MIGLSAIGVGIVLVLTPSIKAQLLGIFAMAAGVLYESFKD